MFSMQLAIRDRLSTLPELSGWDMRVGTEHSDRSTVPAVDVRCTDASAGKSDSRAVTLSPIYTVILALGRSAGAPALLDGALQAVVASLHHWRPGQVAGRTWQRLELRGVELAPADSPTVAYAITFETSSVYIGSPS